MTHVAHWMNNTMYLRAELHQQLGSVGTVGGQAANCRAEVSQARDGLARFRSSTGPFSVAGTWCRTRGKTSTACRGKAHQPDQSPDVSQTKRLQACCKATAWATMWQGRKGGEDGQREGKEKHETLSNKQKVTVHKCSIAYKGWSIIDCIGESYLTDSRDRALITMVRASSTWAAAVTLLSAITRSCGLCRAAACSPRVTLPEELLSTEVWQPKNTHTLNILLLHVLKNSGLVFDNWYL